MDEKRYPCPRFASTSEFGRCGKGGRSGAARCTIGVVSMREHTFGGARRAALAVATVALLAAPAAAQAKQAKLTPLSAFMREGDSGTHNLKFELLDSKPGRKPVKVDYATSAGTASAADYTDVTGTAKIKHKAASAFIKVPVHGDLNDEYAETVKLKLSNPRGAKLTRNHVTGFILDDDPAPTVSIHGTSQDEGNSGSGNETLPVTLSRPSGKPISVDAQTVPGGNATPGSDYTTTGPTQLNFAPGDTEQDFTVPILGDATYENDEVFVATVSNPSPTVSMGTAGAVGFITNDDDPPSLAIDDVQVHEGDTGTVDAVFTVTLTGATDLPASVDFATGGQGDTATPGADYVSTSGTLDFAAGETSKQITVQIIGDTTAESDEIFTVGLSGATAATIADSSGIGQIIDNDP